MEEIQGMSDAEKEIMEIIWNSGGSIYIAELLEKAEENGRGWKRTTIRTFITRLIEKGFIISTRRGRMSEYTAAVTREEYLSGQAHTFVREYFDGSVKHLLTSLFGQEQLDSEAADELHGFGRSVRRSPDAEAFLPLLIRFFIGLCHYRRPVPVPAAVETPVQ